MARDGQARGNRDESRDDDNVREPAVPERNEKSRKPRPDWEAFEAELDRRVE